MKLRDFIEIAKPCADRDRAGRLYAAGDALPCDERNEFFRRVNMFVRWAKTRRENTGRLFNGLERYVIAAAEYANANTPREVPKFHPLPSQEL
jgi:hypothetical protein